MVGAANPPLYLNICNSEDFFIQWPTCHWNAESG
jgi:hypothetical protein